MHGRWKRFDDNVMQPLFGRMPGVASDSDSDDGTGLPEGTNGRGPRAWPKEPMSPATELAVRSPPPNRRNLRPRSKSEGQTGGQAEGHMAQQDGGDGCLLDVAASTDSPSAPTVGQVKTLPVNHSHMGRLEAAAAGDSVA